MPDSGRKPSEAAMPPYDPEAICPKCGQTPVGTRFCTYSSPSYSWRAEWHWPFWVNLEGGHHHRECGRCKHHWTERALDSRVLSDLELAERITEWNKGYEEYLAQQKKLDAIWHAPLAPVAKKKWPF